MENILIYVGLGLLLKVFTFSLFPEKSIELDTGIKHMLIVPLLQDGM